MFSAATRNLLVALAIQAAVGSLVGLAFHLNMDEDVARTSDFFIRALIHGAIVGLGIGLTADLFENHVAPRFARLPLLLEMLTWSVLMSLGIIVSLLGGFWLVFGREVIASATPRLPLIVSVTFIVAVAYSLVSRIARLIGSGYLVGILMGSYLRPRLESRIVLFLDLEGSTAMAERLGETRMQNMIAQFFSDIDSAFTETEGEVVSYLGDGVIVVWPTSSPARNGRAALSLMDARRIIAGVAERYREHFGADPHFRAGLHLGPVSIGEIGGRRRQISLFGDTMNVAARLQEAAKTTSHGWIASRAYVEAATLPPGVEAEALGPLTLRGRAQPIEAFTLAAS